MRAFHAGDGNPTVQDHEALTWFPELFVRNSRIFGFHSPLESLVVLSSGRDVDVLVGGVLPPAEVLGSPVPRDL